MIPSGREPGSVPGRCRRFQDASPAAGAGRGSKPGFALGHVGWSHSVHHPPRPSPWGELPRLLNSHLENAVGFGPGCPPLCPCWRRRRLSSTKPPRAGGECCWQLLLASSLPRRLALTACALQKVAIRGLAGLVMGQRQGQPRCRLWCLSMAGSRGRQSKHAAELQPGAAPDLPGPEHPPVLCGAGGFRQLPPSGEQSPWGCLSKALLPSERVWLRLVLPWFLHCCSPTVPNRLCSWLCHSVHRSLSFKLVAASPRPSSVILGCVGAGRMQGGTWVCSSLCHRLGGRLLPCGFPLCSPAGRIMRREAARAHTPPWGTANERQIL